jgi:hypothetical protein
MRGALSPVSRAHGEVDAFLGLTPQALRLRLPPQAGTSGNKLEVSRRLDHGMVAPRLITAYPLGRNHD